jgi:4-amino-4-deoxy-L-arabinose transferase-like glycosyltransferase
LEKYGLSQYNIRGVDIVSLPLTADNSIKLMAPQLTKIGEQGAMLKRLINHGLSYYDLPLFQNAPGFPFALMLSHKIFAAKTQPYATVFSNDNRLLADLRAKLIFKMQFFATIIPLFFSLMTILAIYILGKYLFSARIGLYAAFIYSVNPVNLLTSQKIWADDMLTFFVLLAVIMFIIAFKKEIPYLAIFAGLACGIATLAKQSGALLLPPIWIFTVFLSKRSIRSLRDLSLAVFNSYFIFFFVGFLVSAGFWFYKVYLVYGAPFFRPEFKNVILDDKTGWFKRLATRPHSYILFSVGIPYLCPLFFLAYYSIKNFIIDIIRVFMKRDFNYEFIILWLWILGFFIVSFKIGKEHRYMQPIYPALAVLAAYYLDKIRKFIKDKGGNLKAEILIIQLLILNAMWSIPIGISAIFENRALLIKPF